jgi:hypothetical protein
VLSGGVSTPCASGLGSQSGNGFSQWLSFGNNGVLADNDPEEQEKLIKLNTLPACRRPLAQFV